MKLGETLPRALPASEEVRAAGAAERDLRASGGEGLNPSESGDLFAF